SQYLSNLIETLQFLCQVFHLPTAANAALKKVFFRLKDMQFSIGHLFSDHPMQNEERRTLVVFEEIGFQIFMILRFHSKMHDRGKGLWRKKTLNLSLVTAKIGKIGITGSGRRQKSQDFFTYELIKSGTITNSISKESAIVVDYPEKSVTVAKHL
uniref:Uncharacterized protein n=1 Tax=Romanomermis culicivorax TaxID=13658 RepID=A0A915IY51_ROMCU